MKPENDQRLSDHISLGVLTRVFPPELVDRVVEKGLAERKPSTTDRRSTLVNLTPAGAKVLGELSVLTYAEIQTKFVELMNALQRVLDDKPQPQIGEKKESARPKAKDD